MRLYLIIPLLFSATTSFGQYSLNLQAGEGAASFGLNDVSLLGGPSITSAFTFTSSLTFLSDVSRITRVGAAVYYQQYSVTDKEEDLFISQRSTTIHNNSTYLFIAPALEFQWNKIFSIGLQPSVGILLHGHETTTGFSNTTTFNSDTSLHSIVVQMNVIFKEQFQIKHGWALTLTETLGFMVGTLTRSESYSQTGISPTFLSIQLGVLRRHTW